MQTSRKIVFYLIVIFSTLLIVLSLLSLVYDLSFWYSKILDFPRQQYLVLGLIFIFLFIIINRRWNFFSYSLILGLLATVLIQGNLIYPYLYGEKSVPDFKGKLSETENSFDILLANVLVTNRESATFLKIVEQWDPDILLVVEVDNWWKGQLDVLKENYPFQMMYPLENAYGMLIYSKLPMEDEQIKFLKHGDVPSFHMKMTLPSGKFFTFHAVHPVAPVPSDRYPDNVGKEEVALLKIGELVAQDNAPSIVAGDFNDVSWSHTARMFGEKGNLKNVRIGRGIYNTFDATSPILRWPLDHIFVTPEFDLVEIERLQKFGSDHFPIYARFVLER